MYPLSPPLVGPALRITYRKVGKKVVCPSSNTAVLYFSLFIFFSQLERRLTTKPLLVNHEKMKFGVV